MLYSLILSINLILILAGLYFLFHTLILSILLKGKKEHYIIVIAKDDDKDLFNKILRAHIQVNMLCFSGNIPVYVIDCGLSNETKSRLMGYFCCPAEVIFIEQNRCSDFFTRLD